LVTLTVLLVWCSEALGRTAFDQVREDSMGPPGYRSVMRSLAHGHGSWPGGPCRPPQRYLSWLTSFVGLALMLAWGMWFRIAYRRWTMIGLLSFVAVQVLALTAVLLIIGARLAQRQPLLHHADHRRADRPARRPHRGAAGRRATV
jgi:hypothetical protein